MTHTLKSLNDSDLELICGGGTGTVAQNPDSRTAPDNIDGDAVTAGSQGGGSASFGEIAQNIEYPESAL